MTLASAPKVGVEALVDAPPDDPSEISAADTATKVRGAPRIVMLAQKPGQLQPFVVRGLICQNDGIAHELCGGWHIRVAL